MSGNVFPAFFKVGCNNIVVFCFTTVKCGFFQVKVYVVIVKMKIVMVTVHVFNSLVILLV